MLATDRDSVRKFDQDGRLHVKTANICRCGVPQYYGHEIPNWSSWGLSPDQIYRCFRPADEIKRAAATSNGIQILQRHVPVDVNDHKPFNVIGSTGTDAAWDYPYLTNSLHIWSQPTIDAIETEERREISPGYSYVPVLENGAFGGEPYSIRMTGIRFNHITICDDARQPGLIVGDTAIQTEESNMSGLATELRKRFSSPAEVLRRLGVPADSVTLPKKRIAKDSFSAVEAERRRSMPRDEEEDARQAAMHGHVTDGESEWDMEPIEAHLRARLGKDDFEQAMDPIRRSMRGARDDEETESNLESEKNCEASSTNFNERDRMRAKGTEGRSDVQSEDNLRANHISGNGRGGRWAGGMDADAHFDEMFPGVRDRIGTSMSLSGVNQRSVGPNNLALDSLEQNKRFLEELRRMESK
jgi:hypothetical protein